MVIGVGIAGAPAPIFLTADMPDAACINDAIGLAIFAMVLSVPSTPEPAAVPAAPAVPIAPAAPAAVPAIASPAAVVATISAPAPAAIAPAPISVAPASTNSGSSPVHIYATFLNVFTPHTRYPSFSYSRRVCSISTAVDCERKNVRAPLAVAHASKSLTSITAAIEPRLDFRINQSNSRAPFSTKKAVSVIAPKNPPSTSGPLTTARKNTSGLLDLTCARIFGSSSVISRCGALSLCISRASSNICGSIQSANDIIFAVAMSVTSLISICPERIPLSRSP